MRVSLRKIIPWILGVLLLSWLYIAFYSIGGYQETLIPSGTETFTASFARVSYIIPVNEDVSFYDLVEENPISATVQITDTENGNVYQVDITDSFIHTNGYANKDNVYADGLPLELEEEHTYTIQYWATCDGQTLDDLSLALYGEQVSYRWLQVLVLVTVLVGAVGLYGALREGRAMIPAMLLLWISVYILYLYSMPLQMRDGEERAFARAYTVSNEMMGRETEDADGYVYVEDVGLRNNGYLVYDIPFYRFWSHIGADVDTSVAATGIYQDDGVRTLRTYVDAASISVARTVGVSYPLVYLAIAIACGVIGAIVIGVILCRCRNTSTRIRVVTIALFPSLFSVLQLHSGLMGLFRPLDAEYIWLQLDEILQRIVLYLDPADGKEYFISYVPCRATSYLITYVPLVVIGMFVYRRIRRQTISDGAERLALIAMAVGTVVNALLRLEM